MEGVFKIAIMGSTKVLAGIQDQIDSSIALLIKLLQ